MATKQTWQRHGGYEDDSDNELLMRMPGSHTSGGVSSEFAPDVDFAHPPGYVEFESSSRIVLNYSSFEDGERRAARPADRSAADYHHFD